MKQRILLLAIIGLVLIGAYILPAAASNTTDALYRGTIVVTNNSTSESRVVTVFTGNVTSWADLGYMNTSGNNTAIVSATGADLAYMPGYAGNVWALWVPSIGDYANLNDILYMGGSTDMAADIRYFPGYAGMSTQDNASLEPSDNFSFTISGQVTPTATGDNISYTTGADNQGTVWGINWGGQTFTITPGTIMTRCRVDAYRNNNPGTITASIRAVDGTGKPTGSDLATGTTNGNGWGTSADWEEIAFTTNYTAVDTQYALVIRALAGDGANYMLWERDDTSPTYTGGTNVYSTDNGTSWSTAANDYMFQILGPGTDLVYKKDAFYIRAGSGNITSTIYGGASVTSAVSTGEHIIDVSADSANLILSIDGSVEDTTALGGVGVPNNGNGWLFVEPYAVPYMEYLAIDIGGAATANWSWEYDDTFTDTISSIIAAPSFRSASSDPHVSANLTLYGPISEADAPAYTLSDAPDFITTTPDMSGNFSATAVNATYPGSSVISSIAIASDTPEQLPTILIFTSILVIISLTVSAIFRNNGTGTINAKAGIVAGIMFVYVALGIYDVWQVYFFGLIALGVMWLSRQREAY